MSDPQTLVRKLWSYCDVLRDDGLRRVTTSSSSGIFKHRFMAGGTLADLLARVQVRYPSVPIVFCDTRPLAEEWTFRFLGAALAGFIEQPEDPSAPRMWID